MKRSSLRLNRHTWLVASLPLLSALCAAAPPPEGTTLNTAVGGDRYSYISSGGCNTLSYVNKVDEASAHTALTYRHESGATAVVEDTVSYNFTYSSEPIEEQINDDTDLSSNDHRGERIITNALMLRAGWHWAHGGGELGGALWAEKNLSTGGDWYILPSARIWLGTPDIIYGWADIFAGPMMKSYLLPVIGLGHAGDNFRVELGTDILQSMLQGQIKVSEKLWLGGRLHYKNSDIYAKGFGGMLTLSYDLDDL